MLFRKISRLADILKTSFENLNDEFKNALKTTTYGGDLQSAKAGWDSNKPYTRVQLLYRLNFATLPSLTSKFANKLYAFDAQDEDWYKASEAERKNILKELFKNL